MRAHGHGRLAPSIAPRLQQRGYACLAVDLRSGMNVLGYVNETYSRAKARQLATGYLAAPRVEAAIQYARCRPSRGAGPARGQLVFSKALALVIASRSRSVAAVAAFSPGEYLKGVAVGTVVDGVEVVITWDDGSSERRMLIADPADPKRRFGSMGRVRAPHPATVSPTRTQPPARGLLRAASPKSPLVASRVALCVVLATVYGWL
jgi:hypothetical protein